MDQPASSGVADPSPILKQAVDRFTASLTDKQKKSFQACTLDDVRQAALKLQNQQEAPKKLRNMNRIQGFLEGMDEYRKVIEAFLNCTPFLGYAWGPIRFALMVTDAWVKSQDIILDAYVDIGERLLAFTNYRSLFEDRPDMRRVLELYYCDIIEFHYHATAFLNRPGWKKFFNSMWKTFDARFKQILASMGRNKELIESNKGTLAITEIQKTHESVKENFQEMLRLERKKDLMIVTEKLNATDVLKNHLAASDRRAESASGHWIPRNPLFSGWESGSSGKARLFISGIPGAGKTILTSYIIECLQREDNRNVVYFYCKANEAGKTRFEDILRSITSQIAQKDVTLGLYLYEKLAPVDASSLTASLKGIATEAIQSQEKLFIVIDGLDEMADEEAGKTLDWLHGIEGQECKLVCLGQRTDVLLRKMIFADHLQLECTEHNADIKAYIRRQMSQLRQDFELTAQAEESIAERIIRNAQGMFLYAKLVLENLLSQTSLNDLNEELEPTTFPINWKAAYGRNVSTIFKNGPQQPAAIRIVSWVACAIRPLKWREMQAAFFIDPGSGTADYRGAKIRKSCKKLCGSLVEVQGGREEPEPEHVLRLVHETAREYLVKEGLLDCTAQHANMASFCIDYLLSAPFRSTSLQYELGNHAATGYYAFQDYAVAHWMDHITRLIASPKINIQNMAQSLPSLFEEYDIPGRNEYTVSYNEQGCINKALSHIPSDTRSRNLWSEMERRITRIRAALVRKLQPSNDCDTPEHQSRDMYGALQFKCPKIGCHHFSQSFHNDMEQERHVRQHERPFSCIDVNCPYHILGFETEESLGDHVTQHHEEPKDAIAFPQPRLKTDTLTKACRRGDLLAVKKLIANGAKGTRRDTPYGKLPLTAAIQHNQIQLFNYLLQSADDLMLNEPYIDWQELCFYALQQIHADILETLEQRIPLIDTNHHAITINVAKDLLKRQQLPLICLHYLLDKDWLVKAMIRDLLPLALSAQLYDHTHSILDYYELSGGLPNDSDILGTLPTAIAMSSTKIAQRLVALYPSDVDINEEVLLKSIRARNHELVQQLLDSGRLETSLLRERYVHILHVAQREGHLGIVDMLRSARREDFWPREVLDGWTDHQIGHRRRCFAAAESKDKEAIDTLLHQDPSTLNSTDEKGSTLLGVAVKRRDISLLKFLLQYPGIDVNLSDVEGRSILIIACEEGLDEILDILLRDDRTWLADVDMYGRSAFWLAAAKNHLNIIELLQTKQECDLRASDRFGISVAMAAVVGFDAIERETALRLTNVDDDHGSLQDTYRNKKSLIDIYLQKQGISIQNLSIVDILKARTTLKLDRPNPEGLFVELFDFM